VAAGAGFAKLDDWQRWGEIPRGAQLGLLLGLKARGYTMAPQLVGVDGWADGAAIAQTEVVGCEQRGT